MSRTLLVVGGTGFVGRHVVARALADGWRVHATSTRERPDDASTWHRFDLREEAGPLLDAVAPDAVVNAGAVIGADPALDRDVNADGAVALAREVARGGSRLVHVSTDSVHGGREAPYDDEEPASPLPWSYALAKAAAEAGILALDLDAALVRPSLILSDDPDTPGPHDHFDRAYFTDMVRQPVLVTDLAELVVTVADGDLRGTLHAAGPQEVTRFDLARGLARRSGADPDLVRPARLAEAEVPRPAVLRLRTTRALALGVRLRPVGDVVPL